MQSRTLPDPLTWFPFELPFALKLLETYVHQIESQVDRGITEFRQGEGTEIVEVNDDSGDTVAVHKGIHSGLWDLRSVFEGYMPNLQRRSALITLFSFLETELDRLCDRVRIHERSALQVTDLADKGIIRATTYLAKVGGLTGIRSSPIWAEIRNIQAIRNLIVHSEGQLPEPSDSRRGKIAAYIEATSCLSGTDSVSIESGYLAHSLATFTAFFQEVHEHMQRRYSAA
jgi:hypothetical protein